MRNSEIYKKQLCTCTLQYVTATHYDNARVIPTDFNCQFCYHGFAQRFCVVTSSDACVCVVVNQRVSDQHNTAGVHVHTHSHVDA